MTENYNSEMTAAYTAYKTSIKEESPHEIGGKTYLPRPLEISQFKDEIKKSLSNPDDIYKSIEESLIFTANNSESFCGLSPENFYGTKEEQESTINGSAKELTQMIVILTENSYQDINIPEQFKKVFSNTEKPNIETIIKGTRRGMKTAEKCHACEQVDPMVGAMVHTAAGILTKVVTTDATFMEANPDLGNLWKDMYFDGSITELSSPKTTGIVDVLITMTEKNKEKFPNMDKFFGSELTLDGFHGTYYDMVNLPEYQ
jgi:hypothetical protein